MRRPSSRLMTSAVMLAGALATAAALAASDGTMVPFTGPSQEVTVGPGITRHLADVPAATADELAEMALRPPRSHVQGALVQNQLPPGAVGPVEAAPGEDPPPATLAGDQDLVGSSLGGFAGLAASGWIPPDTVMAVGKRDVVEAVNSGFAVYSKHGTLRQGYTNFETFFQPAWPGGWNSTNGFFFDPRVEYSPGTGRLVMLVLAADFVAQTSHVFIAVSLTDDPAGSWWLYRFDNVLGTDAWLDYAGLGVDEFGVYFTGNLFFYAGGFKGSVVAHFGTAIFSGGGSGGCYKGSLTWPAGGSAFSLQAAHAHSVAGGAETFFVNTFSASGNQILLWELTGDRTACTSSLTRGAIGTTAYNAINGNVDQAGSATDIDGGDARVMDAVYANRRVFATLGSDPSVSGLRSAFFVEKLDVDTVASDWEHVYDSGNGHFYFYPAITLVGSSASAPIVVGSSYVAPAFPAFQYASSAVKFYTAQGTSNAGPIVPAAQGLGAYVALDSNNRNRWGDYSGADYDWSCGEVWTALEHAGTANTWRTQINRWDVETSPTHIFSDDFDRGHYFCFSAAVP